MKTMAAGAFKVHCLKVMDEVQSKRQAVLITKRGKPVAKLVPVQTRKRRHLWLLQRQDKNQRRYRFPSFFSGGMGRLVLILLDTHVVIWLAQDQQRISSRARDAIISSREGVQGLAVSTMTLLELARLASQKRIELTPNLEDFLRDVERRFAVLPITGRICAQAFEFPVNYPKDRADRVIGATAVIEGLSLVTADQAIRQSKAVPTIW